ncbi:MAG: hypothetical protein JNG83_02625 [Opitutaceae bacterium]|nr:hypothetical protein [Opitutaceae bacterium]
MNRFDDQWRKLTAAARSAPAEPAPGIPYGFAVRVAAQAAAAPAGPWAALERFGLRGLAVAAACGVAAITFNLVMPPETVDELAAGDTVGELLDLS